jgi:DNA-binding beta-propeller fold protein YncE
MDSIEYDPVDDVLYGITDYAATYPITLSLYRINPANGEATLVAPHGNGSLDGLAFDPINHTMYACDILTRELYTIDLSTAALTLVGPFGAGSLPGVGAAYDPSLGLFISDNHGDAAVNDRLFHVDTANGQATLIGNIGYGNVISLAFVPESAVPEPGPGLLVLGALALYARRRAR